MKKEEMNYVKVHASNEIKEQFKENINEKELEIIYTRWRIVEDNYHCKKG